MTRNKMRVAIESGKGMKVKVVKLCWNKWNGPFLMHIYNKQCGIMQKNQWKGPNFQIRCFYNGTLGALCWNAQKTPKLEKLKRKLLNFLKRYDLYRVVPWESQRPGNSENVVVFEFWRFQTIVIGRQSWVKIEENFLRRGDVKKKDTATILSFGLRNWISVGPTWLFQRWFNFEP